ncbi:helix-turn-helix domain-containing protein [Desulfovibrio sp.]
MPELSLKILFGQRVRALREERAMTQAQLAERIGVTEQYVGMIERGLSSPSFGVIHKLCLALGVKPADLFRPSRQVWLKYLLSRPEDGDTPLILRRLAAGVGYWEKDFRTGRLFLSRPIQRMFGYAETPEPIDREILFSRIHPEDRVLVRQWVPKLLAGEGPVNGLFRFSSRLDPEAEPWPRMALALADLETDPDGRPLAACGALIEITELLAEADGGDQPLEA